MIVRFWQEIHQLATGNQARFSLAQTLALKNLETEETVEREITFYCPGDSPYLIRIWFETEIEICPQIGWSVRLEVDNWNWAEMTSMVKHVSFLCKRNLIIAELAYWDTNFAEDIAKLLFQKKWNL